MNSTLRLLFLALLLLPASCGDAGGGGGSGDTAAPVACAASGSEGCPCHTSGACDRRDDGLRLVCSDGVCVAPRCDGEAGLVEGCLCGGGAPCSEGLVCVNGACAPDTGQTLVPPAEPKCYTPCRGGYTAPDGTWVPCSAEGLLPGCIGAAVCDRGTCVVPTPPAAGGDGTAVVEQALEAGPCDGDADCPDFQVCIEHRCYSDCERDRDCNPPRTCVKMVCRVACATDQPDSCAPGEFCSTTNGLTGFCMPLPASDPPTPPPVAGSFSLSQRSVDLSSLVDGGSFVITNHAPTALDFTITKVSHTEFTDEGITIVRESPLSWVLLGSDAAAPAPVPELVVHVEGDGGKAVITIAGPANPTLARWAGALRVVNDQLGEQTVLVSFTASPEGQWTGRVYYFAKFGTTGLDDWMKDREDRGALELVQNALVRRWGALRDGYITVDEFRAALQATLTGSWRWPTVQARCPDAAAPNPNAACYPYDNAAGLSVYADYEPDNPVPTGVVEFPMVMNLRALDAAAAPAVWGGRIVSSQALNYAGDPAVDLVFASDPVDCSDSLGGACVTLLESFDADVFVGGRYETDPADQGCRRAASGTFGLVETPWLVPGFEADTYVDAAGQRARFECRDGLLPFGEGAKARNASLAGSNPIPDGATRRRHIELIDGALVDQRTIYILFRERFPSFLDAGDADGFAAHGIMELRRSEAVLADEDYRGATPEDVRVPPGIEGVGCSQETLEQLFPPERFSDDPDYGPLLAAGVRHGDGMAASVARTMLDGFVWRGDDRATDEITEDDDEKVHYYCEETDLFDGGPGDYRAAPGLPCGADGDCFSGMRCSAAGTCVPEGIDYRVECPVGSRVEFFTLQGPGATQDQVALLPCQEDCGTDADCIARKGTRCRDTLAGWKADATHAIRWDIVWRCTDEDAVYCNTDRLDLRTGKTFYRAQETDAVERPLDLEIEDAFRYKTKFRNRSGTNLGFAPGVCDPVSDAVPYCYDPGAIERIRGRVDCVVHLYADFYDELDGDTQVKLRDFLVRTYAYDEELVFGQAAPVVHDGFERLYSELLIMMGDEAYTSAFQSRFDLAGLSVASFRGSAFEPGGIDLSGGAGFEMFNLYLATQYYQLALDRFYKLSPVIWASLRELPTGQGFVTQATVSSYFSRLIRASSQKTRAFSEIAKRYQAFNRADLARGVIDRAYTAAYLESIVLSRLMLKVVDVASPSDKAQIEKEVETAQRTYRVALLEMRNVYQDITDNQTYFGFQPDYIPFPTFTEYQLNAFLATMERVTAKLAIAADKEAVALADNRAFETDGAQFQAELASLTRDYETELGNLCGTFTVVQGGTTVVYPAIPDYAYLNERASLLGDPCGLMGNGDIHEAMVELEMAGNDLDGVRMKRQHLQDAIDDLNARLAEQCDRIHEFKDFTVGLSQGIMAAETVIRGLDYVIELSDRMTSMLNDIGGYVACVTGVADECILSFSFLGLYAPAAAANLTTWAVVDLAKVPLEIAITEMEITQQAAEIEDECTALTIDTKYEARDLMRQALELNLEAVNVQYGVQLAASKVTRLRNDATAAMANEANALEHLIDVEAARNDPNVRIYRNDAILAADRTFWEAVREAYRATRIYEYYTSQSYAALDKLFLVRMVAHGDYSLESYLAELQEAFVEFDEQYGKPDTRVQVVSLRDDILAIPRLGPQGTALTEQERSALLREKIQDVSLLDAGGYIVLNFSTSLDDLSPLTRDHKLLYVEAEIIGEDVGDALGRVYLQQTGTGVVRRVDGEKSFYAFPERVAVVDTFFNGDRVFPDEVYRSERFLDRPVVNTGWQLVLNRKDEQVNEDIELSSLTDIRLYLYYTDFTRL